LAAAGELDAFDGWNQIHRWTPHQLRHAFATRAGDAFGGQLDTIAAALGHKHIDATAIYAHLNRNKAAEVALAIG